MKRLISQGQAIRSTFGRARVTHFISASRVPLRAAVAHEATALSILVTAVTCNDAFGAGWGLGGAGGPRRGAPPARPAPAVRRTPRAPGRAATRTPPAGAGRPASPSRPPPAPPGRRSDCPGAAARPAGPPPGCARRRGAP